jgi:fucose permease
MALQLLVIFMVFYVMGFGDVRGSFVGISKEAFGVSAAQGSLIPFCGAVAFGCFALPAGLLASRKGKKFVIQVGLLVTVAGHLLPWLLPRGFLNLLAGIFLIGVGMTFLLVAGNPLMRDVADPERFARNLTFAQFIKALGSISGPYFIAFIASRGCSWQGIFPIFALIALATWCALALVRIPEETQLVPASLGDLWLLLKARTIRRKIAGIFLFVGAEMGMNTFLATHMWLTYDMGVDGDAIRYGQGLFWLSQGVGRILGTLALTWLDNRRFFLGCTVAGLAGLGGLILGGKGVAVASVVLCGMSFSNIWPCLFSLTLESRPHRSAEIGGLAVMANVGGAIIPGLMGLVADLTAVRWGFLVPVGAFLYLLVLGLSLVGSRVRPGTA